MHQKVKFSEYSGKLSLFLRSKVISGSLLKGLPDHVAAHAVYMEVE